jgi:hypothetical protein
MAGGNGIKYCCITAYLPIIGLDRRLFICIIFCDQKLFNKRYSCNLDMSNLSNQELATKIIKTKQTALVKELIDNLFHPNKKIQSYSINVFYEICKQGAPELIAPYYRGFGDLLNSRNNRLVWGAMSALDSITLINPHDIVQLLPEIIQALDDGSVITTDHGISILAKLSSLHEYTKTTFPLLLKHLRECESKKLPMYAEKSIIAITVGNKKQFLNLLEERYPELEKYSQQKRINNVIKKIIQTA